MSMSGDQAAAARRRAATTLGYYNLHLGPSLWTLSSDLGVGYVDNIRMLGGGGTNNTGGDFFFHPQLNMGMRFPITDKNTLNFSMGAGYSAYVEHPNLSRYNITPGSELSFDMNVGNVLLDFHERPTIQQYAVEDPTYTGGDYVRFENNAGLLVMWDLNKLALRSGYDHVNYMSLDSGSRYPDGQSEVLFLSAGYSPKAARTFGLEGGLSLLSYDLPTNSPSGTMLGGTQINGGGFYLDQLTEHIQLQAHAGYTVFSPEVSASSQGGSDTGNLYLSLTLTHQLNQRIRHSLSVARTVNTAFYGGNYEIESITWRADWSFIHKISVSTPLSYERWTRVGTTTSSSDTFDRVSAGVTFSRPVSQRLTSSLAYQLYWRGASAVQSSYVVNSLTLNFSYRF